VLYHHQGELVFAQLGEVQIAKARPLKSNTPIENSQKETGGINMLQREHLVFHITAQHPHPPFLVVSSGGSCILIGGFGLGNGCGILVIFGMVE